MPVAEIGGQQILYDDHRRARTPGGRQSWFRCGPLHVRLAGVTSRSSGM